MWNFTIYKKIRNASLNFAVFLISHTVLGVPQYHIWAFLVVQSAKQKTVPTPFPGVCLGAPVAAAAAALFSFHRSDGVITLNWWRDRLSLPSSLPLSLNRTLLIQKRRLWTLLVNNNENWVSVSDATRSQTVFNGVNRPRLGPMWSCYLQGSK